MLERIRGSSLRARLIAALVLTTSAILLVSLIVLHARTGADLNGRVDDRLKRDLEEFDASPAGRARDEAQLRRAARSFIAAQGYHPDSRIFAIELADGSLVTNEPELLEHGGGGPTPESGESDTEERSDRSLAAGMLAGGDGFSTVSGPDGAQLRVLSEPIAAGGDRLGTLHVAESLTGVSEAQAGLSDTILIVALFAIAAVVLVAALIASRLAAPLKRIERFAADVDHGNLDERIETDRGPEEVRSLARVVQPHARPRPALVPAPARVRRRRLARAADAADGRLAAR